MHGESVSYLYARHRMLGLTADLEVLDKRKITCLRRESNQDSSVVQPDLRSTQTLAKPAACLRIHRTPDLFTLFIYLFRRTYIS